MLVRLGFKYCLLILTKIVTKKETKQMRLESGGENRVY